MAQGGKIPSVMPGQSRFAEVPRAIIPRSSFDRSFGHKTTLWAGYLVPVYVDEALPGDTFAMNMTGFARLATPLKPVMDNLVLETFFFAIPYRLVWDNWEKFNGAQDDPGDSTDFTIPQQGPGAGGYAAADDLGNGLQDYMGLPVGIEGISNSSLPLRAYNLVWNEWFRDQNLQNSLTVEKGDGPDVTTYLVRRRGKRHDYFTSCLPFLQKGDSVNLPMGVGMRINTDAEEDGNVSVWATGPGAYRRLDADTFWVERSGTAGDEGRRLYADPTAIAVPATINDLRQAFQIQKLLERDARGGTRYTEVVKSHFGVTSPDARLQRPEYLGGGSTPVVVSPIAQTSSTDVTTPQGNLAAVGTVSWSGHGFVKSFTEHCILLGLVSVRADLNYQQGMERFWKRLTRFDFYWPALAHLGEQVVSNDEIYAVGSGGVTDGLVFGYQERYAEYRYKPSKITGTFRSSHPVSLDIWHLAQDFGVLPTLGDVFIQENPPVNRVIAVPSEPHFLFDSYFHLRCARPMPLYGVPGFIDHF